MTVVCFRAGVLASDRMATTPDDWIVGGVTKIIAIGGMLAGSAGRTSDMSTFFQWIADGRPAMRPSLDDDFSGLLIEADGTVHRYGYKLISRPTETDYHAIGSGTGPALGAMFVGATAEEAVKAACAHALGCGGGIDVLRLAPPEPSSPAAATP